MSGPPATGAPGPEVLPAPAVSAAELAAAVDAFATELAAFAATLPDTDRAILGTALGTAMGPWERMARRPATDLLTPVEAELVDRLEKRFRQEGLKSGVSQEHPRRTGQAERTERAERTGRRDRPARPEEEP
ncbi:hypothetical protein ACIRD3_08000 [Kitasatospora sp. NPDC093550]|uniref:hypothetical protein n=1 Tax=Kitasatospora sp. NPDC093550 TaxID=3364089 RepID=UPI003812BE0F